MVAGYKPPSRNYVVFDDAIVEIMKKYGISAAAAAEVWNKAHGGTTEARNGL